MLASLEASKLVCRESVEVSVAREVWVSSSNGMSPSGEDSCEVLPVSVASEVEGGQKGFISMLGDRRCAWAAVSGLVVGSS